MTDGRECRVDVLRRAVCQAVEHSSLRRTARAVGMSAPGLKHFMDGGTPLRRTVRQLTRWYEAEIIGRISPATAADLLDALFGELAADERPGAVHRAVRCFAETFDSLRAPRPEWVTALLREAD